MGIYVNPERQTKESWLEENAQQVTEEWVRSGFRYGEGRLPICLVDNGAFTAAGVAFDPAERDVFLSTRRDGRPKKWYVAEIEKIKTVTPVGYHRMMA